MKRFMKGSAKYQVLILRLTCDVVKACLVKNARE